LGMGRTLMKKGGQQKRVDKKMAKGVRKPCPIWLGYLGSEVGRKDENEGAASGQGGRGEKKTKDFKQKDRWKLSKRWLEMPAGYALENKKKGHVGSCHCVDLRNAKRKGGEK